MSETWREGRGDHYVLSTHTFLGVRGWGNSAFFERGIFLCVYSMSPTIGIVFLKRVHPFVFVPILFALSEDTLNEKE
jgi:hypothetical protein